MPRADAPKPARPKAKPRMRAPRAALRRAAALDPEALRARPTDIQPDPGLPDAFAVTSWDIGETYIQATRLEVTRDPPAAQAVATASWNLRWDAERETARCGQAVLDGFIRAHPDIMGTDLWLLEEQFDVGEPDAVRGPAGGEVMVEEGGKVAVCIPAPAWRRYLEAVRQQVWKGPFMPIYEASVRMAGLARGCRVVNILPRHVKAVYGLPLEGNAANKAVSQVFMGPRLFPAEERIIREAVQRRDRQNVERGGRAEGRRHDADETVMNALYALSRLLDADLLTTREQALAILREKPPAAPLPGAEALARRERGRA